jgi:hypothetical protein
MTASVIAKLLADSIKDTSPTDRFEMWRTKLWADGSAKADTRI